MGKLHGACFKNSSAKISSEWAEFCPYKDTAMGCCQNSHGRLILQWNAGMRSRSQSRSHWSWHILAGAGVGARAIGTFCLELESEPEPSKMFLLRLQRRGKIIKKKTQNVQCENVEVIIVTAQFLNSHGLGSLSDLRGRAYCPGVAQPHLSGDIGLWHHPTDGTMAGSPCTRVGWDPRTEARPVHLFIYFCCTLNSIHTSWLLMLRWLCHELQWIVRWSINFMK